MSWGYVAVGAGMAIASGLGYLGSREQAGAAKEAASTMGGASKYSADIQYQLGREALGLQRPYYEAGYPLLAGATQAGLDVQRGIWPEMMAEATDYAQSPLTRMQIAGTTEELNTALAARGLYNSGAAIEAIGGATESILAKQAQLQWNKQGQLYGLGMGIVNPSQGAAAQGAAGLQSTGAGVAGTTMQGAQAQIGPLLYGAQSQAQMYQNLGGMGAGLATGYMRNQALNQYLQGLQNWQSQNVPLYSGGPQGLGD